MVLHLSYLQYSKSHSFELFEIILHVFLSEIISETSHTPIPQYFEQKSLTFSDISMPKLSKNMSIASDISRPFERPVYQFGH